ncbi:MAG: lysophospholipid acyltransferase family protein [Deltaproteobacteria bacterium]|nr:lysophospholipid acyltransferase family protein [Deltaproteobacteria bacterium]
MNRRRIGRGLLLLIAPWLASLRMKVVGRRRVEELRAHGAPYLYALWHSDQLLVLPTHRRDDCTVLVSQSEDGALLTGALEGLGYEVVRGSSSRGGVAGWLGLRRAMKRGRTPTFAVDGPRGPARSVAAGVLALARASGAPIVPITASARRETRTRGWDRTRVPWPGSRAVVVYGRPIRVAREEELSDAAARLEASLRHASDRAERLTR